MNAQNAHEYLPLIQALANGKTIQFIDSDGDNHWWADFGEYDELIFDNAPKSYRVKHDPRTFDMWVNSYTGNIAKYVSPNQHDYSFWKRITVQEVLK
jgi:hypothetical protein